MIKARLLLSLFFGFSLCTQAAASSEEQAPSSDARPVTGSFIYQKEVFEPYQTSDIMSDSPALEDLRTDALARLTHLTSLFDFVRENGMNKHTQDLFKKETKAANAYRERFLVGVVGTHQKVTTCLDPRLIILSKLKTDYAVERDLVSYFSKCLEKFSQGQPSFEQIQNLYEQSAYVVRLNVQSLLEKMFNHMMLAYPENFIKIGPHHDQMSVLQDGLRVVGQEDTLYYDYFKMYAGTDFMGENTVDITKRVRSFLTGVPLSDPGVIYELNSILFYLNMERALLSFCPDLAFIPENYPLDTRSRGVQADRFILSKLINAHETGLLGNLLNQTYIEPKKSQLYLSPKMVLSILSASAEKDVNLFLSKIFPDETGVANTLSCDVKEKKKKLSPSGKNKGKAKSKGKGKAKKPSNAHVPHDQVFEKHAAQESFASSSGLPALTEEKLEKKDAPETLFSDFEDKSPQTVRTFKTLIPDETASSSEEAAQNQDPLPFKAIVPTTQSTSTSFTSTPRPVRLPKAPYRARVSYDDYVFQRSISARPIPRYVFNGETYAFTVRPFNLENLREIKRLTHHTSERPPNVASYTLRFHMRDGQDEFFQEFTPQDLYLSGGHYFDRERDRLNLHVQNAYHSVLDQSQQGHFMREEPRKRGLYLGKILEKEVRECIVGGAWKNNCTDSEAILLLDLTHKMPKYLKALAKSGSPELEITAVSLGIATYYDVCWRCRNLLQGWQWGLKDLIAHARPGIKISPDFSTLVMGFGEVRPQTHHADIHPPRFFEDAVILGAGKNHKFASVNMKRAS